MFFRVSDLWPYAQKFGGFPVNSKVTVFRIKNMFSCLSRWIPCAYRRRRTNYCKYDARHARSMVAGWWLVAVQVRAAAARCIYFCVGILCCCAWRRRFCHACRRRHLAAMAHAAATLPRAHATRPLPRVTSLAYVARLRRSDGGCSACWQWLACPCWLCPKHKACTSDTAGDATSCKRFHC